MKKSFPTKTTSRSANSKKPLAEKPSAAAQQLGGQPENDEDARAAGFASATAPGTARKPRKTKTT